jgi:tartrate dehydratase alpha subunit/fumarate hydratase class I-like protein
MYRGVAKLEEAERAALRALLATTNKKVSSNSWAVPVAQDTGIVYQAAWKGTQRTGTRGLGSPEG